MADEKLKSLEARLARLESVLADSSLNFGPIVDPPPWGGGYPWPPRPFPWPIPNPVVDPVPFPWGTGVRPRLPIGPIGPIGDPPPIDIGRFSKSQLESALHSIKAEKVRLDAMEEMLNKQLNELG